MVEDQLMLVKEDGKWKVSILASALMNSFGGMINNRYSARLTAAMIAAVFILV